jgi:PAS domain S-box-containing protein
MVNECRAADAPRTDAAREAPPARAAASPPERAAAPPRWRDALLASLSRATPLALYAVDDRTGAVIHASETFLATFGVGAIGDRVRSGEASHAEVMAACAAATADPAAFLRASGPPPEASRASCSVEEVDLADGRALRRFVSPVELEGGETVGRIFVFEDVTPYRRMMRLFDNSQVIMFRWVATAGWPVEACSKSVAQWGYSAEDFTSGRVPYASIVHPDDLERVAREVSEHTAAGVDRFRQLYRIRARDGAVRHLDDHTLVVRDAAGRATHYEGTILDVTERTDLEAQLLQSQKMEAVGLLASGIAHDFNNLLMAVNLNCEALLRPAGPRGPLTPERQRALIEDIRAAGLRATALTRRILSFSRREPVDVRLIDIGDIVYDVERMLVRLLGEDIALETRLTGGLRRVLADPGQFEQVIVNLALNARDAMPRGGRLSIAVENLPGQGEAPPRVRLVVEDTGTGMDEATLARIFEPFFTTKLPGRGTGLGLPTVKRIVAQAGGTISVESEPGKGTRFTIDLPAAPEGEGAPAERSAGTAAPPAAAAGDGEARGRGEAVLIVEDDDAVRRLIAGELRERGYAVEDARRGPDALAIAAREGARVDLLIADVVMPDMSGPELAERLARDRPGLATLYLTGYADDAPPGRGEAGARAAVLQKPVGPDALARAVRAALDRAAAERAAAARAR